VRRIPRRRDVVAALGEGRVLAAGLDTDAAGGVPDADGAAGEPAATGTALAAVVRAGAIPQTSQ
jgi:hypothetical protein